MAVPEVHQSYVKSPGFLVVMGVRHRRSGGDPVSIEYTFPVALVSRRRGNDGLSPLVMTQSSSWLPSWALIDDTPNLSSSFVYMTIGCVLARILSFEWLLVFRGFGRIVYPRSAGECVSGGDLHD
jgi:hypothetical protein